MSIRKNTMLSRMFNPTQNFVEDLANRRYCFDESGSGEGTGEGGGTGDKPGTKKEGEGSTDDLRMSQEQLNTILANHKRGLKSTIDELQKNNKELSSKLEEVTAGFKTQMSEISDLVKNAFGQKKDDTDDDDGDKRKRDNQGKFVKEYQLDPQTKGTIDELKKQIDTLAKQNKALAEDNENTKKLSALEKKKNHEAARDLAIVQVLGEVALHPEFLLPGFRDKVVYDEDSNQWQYVSDRENDIRIGLKDGIEKALPDNYKKPKKVTPAPGSGGAQGDESGSTQSKIQELETKLKGLKEKHAQSTGDIELVAQIGNVTREINRLKLPPKQRA